ESELEAEREEQLARGETPKYSGRDRNLTESERKAYEEKGLKPVVRFRVPEGQDIVIDDAVRGKVTFESDGIGDFVIARKDGVPMYNFAVTVDDHLMKITHVIRGEEHLSNTPRQVMLYQAFGWETPRFAHASLILNPNRQKMSKRDESIIQFVEQYKELGYMPEAIVNFLSLLGWSP
ncbi:glutamate--tRNA ligase, partial [Flavobacterium sp. IR1]